MAARAAQTPSVSCVMPAYNEGRKLATVVP
ncbi:hypothetical protein SAMN05421875_1228 [Acidovorax soli]|uniref:Glycosyl transferase family 2 n=1 Tax=Acidovorax soli TaxID=592050 RepID=A0A1H4D1B6_9BURK|nr:hypothetical protein SAMN05421875_1228 [Acidovorax soli]